MDLTHKIALITGGTRGIGAAAAIALAKDGADIALVARHEDDDARSTKQAIQALGRRCELILADCAIPADCGRAVEDTVRLLGGVHVLVHSAGGGVPGGLLEVTPEAWHAAFDVHVHAIFHLSRAAVPQMRAGQDESFASRRPAAAGAISRSYVSF